jgi:acetyl esterase/lipase
MDPQHRGVVNEDRTVSAILRPMRCIITAALLACMTFGASARQDASSPGTGEPSSPAPSTPATTSLSTAVPAGLPNRELLAWWYLEVDRAWEAARPNADAAATRVAHEAFDRATLAFFRFDMADAVKQLARLRRSLRGGPPDAPVHAVSMQVSPRVWVKGREAPTAAIAPLDRGGVLPASLTLTVTGGSNVQATFAVTPRRAQGQANAWTLDGIDWAAVGVLGGDQPAACLALSLVHEGEVIAAERLVVARASLADLRERQSRAVDAIDVANESLGMAKAMFESRNGLLTDDPSRNKSSEFLAPYDTLIDSLAAELAALQEGRSPYPRDGAWWTTVQAGKTAIPCWFDAPPPASRRQPSPLLIVLHGAGGDESMFLHGYGQGAVVKAAVAKGWVVVSPGTTAMMANPAATRAVVAAASAMYAIDPSRVYVAGHSMGGAATSMIARRLRDVVAATVCFAGGSIDPKEPCAPTLVLGAEIDPLIPASRLAANVARAAAAGLPVAYEQCTGNGHTLIVGDQAARALAFLEGKRLGPRDAAE